MVIVFGCLAACAAGAIHHDDARLVARNAMIRASGDAAALRRMLRDSVTDGGLRFVDDTCNDRFGKPQEIHGDAQLDAFARCLATLPIVQSTRDDALADVAVLQYAPGFEIEARLVESDSPHLMWIGASARRSTDTAPTITSEALETHRLTGDRDGPLTVALAELEDPAHHAGFVQSWLKVCVDDQGTVTSADSFETNSLLADQAFVAAAKQWTFRPFEVDGAAIPVCAMTRMTYPSGANTQAEVIPLPPPPSRGKRPPVMFSQSAAKLVEGHRIAGTRLVVPDPEDKMTMMSRGETRAKGRFRVCIDEHGTVESVVPVVSTGLPRYDRQIVLALDAWRYSPFLVDSEPVPICTYITFVYTQHR